MEQHRLVISTSGLCCVPNMVGQVRVQIPEEPAMVSFEHRLLFMLLSTGWFKKTDLGVTLASK